MAVSAVSALIGLYALFRDREKRPGSFVELQEDYLLLNLLTEVKIPYGNIATAENPKFTQGPIGQWVGNAVVAWNHLFGGDFPRVGAKGEVNTSVLVIRLKKYTWSFIPFPPFMVPKRRWRLMIDGAESLRAELLEKLANNSSTSDTV